MLQYLLCGLHRTDVDETNIRAVEIIPPLCDSCLFLVTVLLYNTVVYMNEEVLEQLYNICCNMAFFTSKNLEMLLTVLERSQETLFSDQVATTLSKVKTEHHLLIRQSRICHPLSKTRPFLPW